MILVICYKDGKEVRHENCYDIMTADQKAEEFKDSGFYDRVEIVTIGEDHGPKEI